MKGRVLRAQRDIPAATEADLVATVEAMTGAAPTAPQLASRGGLESAASMAILEAENAAGHLGVPKGARPRAMTLDERIARARERGETAPIRAAVREAAEGRPHAPRGLLPEREERAGRRAEAVLPAPPLPNQPRLQAASERRRVFTAVQTRSRDGTPTRVATLVEQFGPAARGHVRKLIQSGHLIVHIE